MTSLPVERTIRRLLLSVFAVIGTCIVLSAPVQAIEQGGIGGRPAYPKADNVRSQSIFVHNLEPGKQAKDGVEVINNTSETKHVLVYAVDSQMSSGGSFACAQAVDKSISVGRWVELAQKELTLKPSAKQTIDFTVTVPKNTTPGEHNGCIVIQDTKQQTAPDSNGIVLSMRSAIRVAITVPGDIQKGLVFTGLGMAPKGQDKILLSTALKNNGNVSLDTQLDVKLVYPFGLTAAKAGGNFPVLSSSEGRFNFESPRPFWGGWYRLAATAQYNDDPSVSLGEGKPTAVIGQHEWIFIAPDPLAAALEAILLATIVGGTVFLVRRKFHDKRALRNAKKHTVVTNENLHTIAGQYGMPWKHLARINKLKPPYQLKTGQILTVTSLPPKNNRKKTKPQSRP